MKLKTAMILLGVAVSSSTAAAFAVPVGHATESTESAAIEPPVADFPVKSQARFQAGQTLTIDARLGHASLGPVSKGETYLFASVAGADEKVAAAPPVNLSIVVDKSGSMRGQRIANALAAARGAVERLREGDTVSVVAFDTRADVVVSPTRVSDATRPQIERDIAAIRLGGDTCISCGLEAASRELNRAGVSGDHVNRIVLLSDGATNHGVTDMPGLRTIASRMRDNGLTISTIGVDVDFDEKVMGALAQEGNGKHYFVKDPTKLADIFAEEFDSVLSSIASSAEMVVELEPGVDVAEVFDRGFRREGNKITIPFGAFSARQEKTALLKLKVPTDRPGDQKVAHVRLNYRDLGKRNDALCDGNLALRVTDDEHGQKELDPFVSARLERSRTAQTLSDANKLFEVGRIDEARARLADRKEQLVVREQRAVALAKTDGFGGGPAKNTRSVDRDFEEQQAFVAQADKAFAAPQAAARPSPIVGAPGGGGAAPAPPAQQSAEGKSAVRQNQAAANDMGL
jgi:Ca-activated chloride channel family protein